VLPAVFCHPFVENSGKPKRRPVRNRSPRKSNPGSAATRKGRALLPASVRESRRTDPDAAEGNGRLEIIADMPGGKRVSVSRFRSKGWGRRVNTGMRKNRDTRDTRSYSGW